MAHHHQTTEDFDPDCERCCEEIQQYYEEAQRAYESDDA